MTGSLRSRLLGGKQQRNRPPIQISGVASLFRLIYRDRSNPGEELTIEKYCFVVAQNSGGPQNAVFGMELRCKCPSSEATVELFLDQPGGELAISIEAETGSHMADHVMDRTKSVVGTAEPAIEKRVSTFPICCTRGDLENTTFTCGCNHLVIGVVRISTVSECNIDPKVTGVFLRHASK
jgi:hypothetical protein